MIIVGDILSQVGQFYGNSTPEFVYEKLNLAIELLQNEGTWNPNIGFMDICSHDKMIVLPPEVEMPLAVNIGGYPANFRNKWFEFHLNGPGTQCCVGDCSISWEDQMELPTFRRITHRSHLCFFSSNPADANLLVRVYGLDENKLPLTHTETDGSVVQGMDFVIGAFCSFGTQWVTRIDRISKPVTKGFVTLQILEDAAAAAITIGVYEPWTKEPSFRRIFVSGGCATGVCGCSAFNACGGNINCQTWVRMRYRRRTYKVASLTDPIFLDSTMAILMAVKAVKKYQADLKTDADAYLAQAVSFLDKKQKSQNGPNTIRLQMQNSCFMGTLGENMV